MNIHKYALSFTFAFCKSYANLSFVLKSAKNISKNTKYSLFWFVLCKYLHCFNLLCVLYIAKIPCHSSVYLILFSDKSFEKHLKSQIYYVYWETENYSVFYIILFDHRIWTFIINDFRIKILSIIEISDGELIDINSN